MANKKEVGLADLFDLFQRLEDPLKRFLDRFNKATVLVDEPGEKYFVATFIKGLKSRGFSEALSIWKPRTMDEVGIQADKHIKAEETNEWKKERAAKGIKRNDYPSG